MKKKISMLLCLVAAASFTLTSCNTAHEHTFSDKWASDATNHWHAATCEHGEEKDGLAKHADANEDGKCDVCDYEVGHKHTYATTWSKDATHHWKAATCTHTGEVSEKALHADLDANYECDECDAHVHIINAVGYCEGCNTQVKPMDENDISMVVAATATRINSIISSNVTYTFESESPDPEGLLSKSSTASYTFGNGVAYEKAIYQDGAETTETWFTLLEDETVNAIQLTYEYDTPVDCQPVSATTDHLLGHNFSVSTLANGYGAETILVALYELSQADSASAFTKTHDAENNTYTFSFNSTIVNTTTEGGETVERVSYFETEVTFVYTDNYELTSLLIATDSYTNAIEGAYDFSWDSATKTVTLLDTATADTDTYSVTQVVGERTYTNDVSVDSFVPTANDFTFTIGDEVIENGTVLEYDLEELEYFEQGMAAPIYMLEVDIAVTEGKYLSLAFGNDLTNSNLTTTFTKIAGSNASINRSGYIEMYDFSEGDYVLSVNYNDEEIWSITIKVTKPAPTGTAWTVTVTDNNIFSEDSLVTFTATQSGTYTFTIPARYGAWDKDGYDNYSSEPYVDPMVDNGGSFSVDIAAGKSYSFYLSAPTIGEHTLYYTFEAKEVSGGEDVGGGDDVGGDDENIDYTTVVVEGTNTLYFSAAEVSADTATRSLTATKDGDYKFASGNLFISGVTDANGNAITKNEDYTYTLTAGNYTLTFGMLSMFHVAADTAQELNVTVTVSTPSFDYDTVIVEGENTLYFSADEITADEATRALTITNDGTYKFNAGALFVASITDANGNTIEKNEDYSYTLTAGDYTVKFSMLSMFGVEADTEQELNVVAVVAESDPVYDTVIVEGTNTLYFSADEMSAGEATRTLTITNDGSYQFNAGTLFVGSITDAEGNTVAKNEDYSYTLTAGNYTVKFTMLSMFGAEADVAQELNVVAATTEAEPDGSEENPYVIENGSFVQISASTYSPVFVTVKAGVTATLDCAAKFYTDPTDTSSAVGTSVCPTEDTLYYVYADSMAGCIGSITGSIASSGDNDDNGLEGSGTDSDPYVIAVGDYTCAFPGGYNWVFYTYTATEAGTLTVTVTSNDYYWGYGSAAYALENVGSTISSLGIELAANETVWIGMSTNSGSVGNVTFSTAWTAGGSSEPVVPSEPDGSEENPYIIENGSFVQISAGTYSPVFVTVKAGVTATLDCAAKFYTDPTDTSSAVGTSVCPTEDTLYYVYADSPAGCMGAITGSIASSGDEDEEPTISYDTVVVLGENTLYFSADEVAAGSATRTIVISEDGEYKLAAGSLYIKNLTDSNGNTITKNESYYFDLTAGTYTINFANLSMFGVQADIPQTLNVNLMS